MKKYIISALFLVFGLMLTQETKAQRRLMANLEYSPLTFDAYIGEMGQGFGFNFGTQYYRRDTYFTHVSLGVYSRRYDEATNLKSSTLYLRTGRCGLVGDTEMDDDFIMYFGWYVEVGRIRYKQVDETILEGRDFLDGDAERNLFHGNIYGLNFGMEKTIDQKFVLKGNIQANILSTMPGLNLTLGAAYRLY